jgi:ADP-ribose pyrophosphatase YjhB (NUDIX family)
LVVLSQDKNKVLLCKRKGEADFDGVYSFIGGKMETTDISIVEGLRREKNEEVGTDFKILIYPQFSLNLLFRKKDGNSMILPHYLAIHKSGDIVLNEEYSEFQWISIKRLDEFEPKIPNVPEVVDKIMDLQSIASEHDFVQI